MLHVSVHGLAGLQRLPGWAGLLPRSDVQPAAGCVISVQLDARDLRIDLPRYFSREPLHFRSQCVILDAQHFERAKMSSSITLKPPLENLIEFFLRGRHPHY